MKTFVLICALAISHLVAHASSLKKVKEVQSSTIEFNLPLFCNYLQNGNPHELEGVYSTKDGRYQLAIVKNDASTHDFIGVVIAADNSYWKKGAIKFNFVLQPDNYLKGYYYDSVGGATPVEMIASDSNYIGKHLIKMDIQYVLNSTLAYETE